MAADSGEAPRDSLESIDAVDAGLDEEIAGDYVDTGATFSWEHTQDRGSAAAFDALTIVQLLGGVGGPSNVDLHAFAYLACLMSVYRGRPASEWGYAFTAVPPTLPYSPALQAAIDLLVRGGLLARRATGEAPSGQVFFDGVLQTTADGEEELSYLGTLADVEGRSEFLSAATSTARMRTVPSVSNALSFEPGIAQATRTSTVRMLLKEDLSKPLYEQFSVMEDLLGADHRNLVIPASLYLRFLDASALEALQSSEDDVQ